MYQLASSVFPEYAPFLYTDWKREMLKNFLKDKFGFDNFKTGQEEVIEKILSGKSAAAIFPTGSGKFLP